MIYCQTCTCIVNLVDLDNRMTEDEILQTACCTDPECGGIMRKLEPERMPTGKPITAKCGSEGCRKHFEVYGYQRNPENMRCPICSDEHPLRYQSP